MESQPARKHFKKICYNKKRNAILLRVAFRFLAIIIVNLVDGKGSYNQRLKRKILQLFILAIKTG